jgi:universal stress protein E
MEKIQRIVAATDFSARANRAVQRAVRLAMEHGAELHLLHVLPIFPLETFKRLVVDTPLETEQMLYNRINSMLQRLAEALARSGMVVRHHVAIGRAHVEINRYAESHHADLIVLGDQGENFAQEFFLGTTVSKTLRKGQCPLLIVKQEPMDQYRHVLVPVDFSAPSRLALHMALKVAPQTPIQVLHVAEMPFRDKMWWEAELSDEKTIESYRAKMLNDTHRAMEEIIADCAPGDTRVTPSIEQGYPPAVIQDKARSLNADLIVIGKRGETELDEALFGSVTKHVLYETACDVLVVSPEKQPEKPIP